MQTFKLTSLPIEQIGDLDGFEWKLGQFFAARTGRTPGASRHVPSAASGGKPSLAAITRGPVTASDAELAANPRARSAKLRVAERTDAPLPAALDSVMALAEMPATADKGRGRR